MEKFSPNVSGFIKLQHKESKNPYAVSRSEWNRFLVSLHRRKNKIVLPDVRAIKLYKNDLNEFDLSKEVELINYKFLRGSFETDLISY
jgi:hypothetical protein